MGTQLAIIGAGRVGQTLGRALHNKNISIGPVVTRSSRTARSAVRFIGDGTPCARLPESISKASLIVVGVPDPQILPMAQMLARCRTAVWRDKVVLHLSGSRTSRDLSPLRQLGAQCGSLHPLLPMPQRLPSLPQPIFFALEGDDLAVAWGKRISRLLGGKSVVIEDGDKVLYHAAAALVGGHLMAIVELGRRMLIRAGFPSRLARPAILSPIPHTLAQYARLGEGAWTGPLARSDIETASKHLEALAGLPPFFSETYKGLGRTSLAVFQGADGGKKKRRLERLLSESVGPSARNAVGPRTSTVIG